MGIVVPPRLRSRIKDPAGKLNSGPINSSTWRCHAPSFRPGASQSLHPFNWQCPPFRVSSASPSSPPSISHGSFRSIEQSQSLILMKSSTSVRPRPTVLASSEHGTQRLPRLLDFTSCHTSSSMTKQHAESDSGTRMHQASSSQSTHPYSKAQRKRTATGRDKC